MNMHGTNFEFMKPTVTFDPQAFNTPAPALDIKRAYFEIAFDKSHFTKIDRIDMPGVVTDTVLETLAKSFADKLPLFVDTGHSFISPAVGRITACVVKDNKLYAQAYILQGIVFNVSKGREYTSDEFVYALQNGAYNSIYAKVKIDLMCSICGANYYVPGCMHIVNHKYIVDNQEVECRVEADFSLLNAIAVVLTFGMS